MTTASAKIVQALLGKAVAETLLVGALAIIFFFQAFPPYFRGFGEVQQQAIVGWANNTRNPTTRVDVQLFIDGNFVGQQSANQFRPDVHAAGWAQDEWHGFRFNLPKLTSGEHQARVYATYQSRGGKRATLQLLGNPIFFVVENEGNIRELKPRK